MSEGVFIWLFIYYTWYNKAVTDRCRVFSIVLGNTPNAIVGINSVNNNINSLLDTSLVTGRYLL